MFDTHGRCERVSDQWPMRLIQKEYYGEHVPTIVSATQPNDGVGGDVGVATAVANTKAKSKLCGLQ